MLPGADDKRVILAAPGCVLRQVTVENHDYCTALAEEHSLGSLQAACSSFQKAQRRLAAKVQTKAYHSRLHEVFRSAAQHDMPTVCVARLTSGRPHSHDWHARACIRKPCTPATVLP